MNLYITVNKENNDIYYEIGKFDKDTVRIQRFDSNGASEVMGLSNEKFYDLIHKYFEENF